MFRMEDGRRLSLALVPGLVRAEEAKDDGYDGSNRRDESEGKEGEKKDQGPGERRG